jgi:hypothetical protein
MSPQANTTVAASAHNTVCGSSGTGQLKTQMIAKTMANRVRK